MISKLFHNSQDLTPEEEAQILADLDAEWEHVMRPDPVVMTPRPVDSALSPSKSELLTPRPIKHEAWLAKAKAPVKAEPAPVKAEPVDPPATTYFSHDDSVKRALFVQPTVAGHSVFAHQDGVPVTNGPGTTDPRTIIRTKLRPENIDRVVFQLMDCLDSLHRLRADCDKMEKINEGRIDDETDKW